MAKQSILGKDYFKVPIEALDPNRDRPFPLYIFLTLNQRILLRAPTSEVVELERLDAYKSRGLLVFWTPAEFSTQLEAYLAAGKPVSKELFEVKPADIGQKIAATEAPKPEQTIDLSAEREDKGEQTLDISKERVDLGEQTIKAPEREDLGDQTLDTKAEREDLGEQTLDISKERVDLGEQTLDTKTEREDLGEQTLDTKAEREDLGEQTLDISKERVDLGEQTIDTKTEREDLGEQTLDLSKEDVAEAFDADELGEISEAEAEALLSGEQDVEALGAQAESEESILAEPAEEPASNELQAQSQSLLNELAQLEGEPIEAQKDVLEKIDELAQTVIESTVEESIRSVFAEKILEAKASGKDHPTIVSSFTVIIAAAVGYSDKTLLGELASAAMLHELEASKTPSEVSATTLEVLKQYMERFDGSGGPTQLIGLQISEHAQIVGIADTLDNMMNGSEGVAAIEPAQALVTFKDQRGKFSPELMAMLRQTIDAA